jgi:hypoxanthine-guanine phosphoribosyltransferase
MLLRVVVYDRDTKTQELDKQEVIGSTVLTVQDILDAGTHGKTCGLENVKIREAGTVTVIGELFDQEDGDHEVILGTCKFKNTSLLGMLLAKP